MHASADSFLEATARTIARHQMLTPGERVLAAVSGGADSIALLRALHELGYPLVVAHMDHQTRHGESAQDAQFVNDLCATLDIRCIHARFPIEAEAAAQGRSFEVHARQRRYDFFLESARKQACAAIATGHHADDVAETVLLRLLRGTSMRGLAGIPPLRLWKGCRIVRPLLEQSREAIQDWLRMQGQTWREDYTNAELHPLRNRIRHALLPELAHSYNPQIKTALHRLTEAARRDNAYLEQATEAALTRVASEAGLHRASFRAEAPALQYRLLAQWCHDQGVPELNAERLDAFVEALQRSDNTGSILDIGAGLQAYLGREHMQLRSRLEQAPSDKREENAAVSLPTPGQATAFGRRFRARLSDASPARDLASFCHARRQVFDADALAAPLILRCWREGDRFQPLGMSGRRKLSDYFQERGIPAPKRKTELLLCSGDAVLWHVGGQPAADAACTPDTQRWLIVETDDETG